jgi:hypothetical protein
MSKERIAASALAAVEKKLVDSATDSASRMYWISWLDQTYKLLESKNLFLPSNQARLEFLLSFPGELHLKPDQVLENSGSYPYFETRFEQPDPDLDLLLQILEYFTNQQIFPISKENSSDILNEKEKPAGIKGQYAIYNSRQKLMHSVSFLSDGAMLVSENNYYEDSDSASTRAAFPNTLEIESFSLLVAKLARRTKVHFANFKNNILRPRTIPINTADVEALPSFEETLDLLPQLAFINRGASEVKAV